MISFTMGVEPRPIDYEDNDHFCWPANETPTVIKVFFAGIEKGPTWMGGDGNPPNGYFDMTRTGPVSNKWSSGDPDPKADLSLTGAESQLSVTASSGQTAFFHEDLVDTCRKYYTNKMGPFGVRFRRGNGWATGYVFPWDVAELVMNAYWNDPKYECFPMDSEVLAIRVARISDGTNIVILFDHDLA